MNTITANPDTIERARICPQCARVATHVLDDFEIASKRYMHIDGQQCSVPNDTNGERPGIGDA